MDKLHQFLRKLRNLPQTMLAKRTSGKSRGARWMLFLDHLTEKLYAFKNRPLIHRIFVIALFLGSFYSLGKLAALVLEINLAPAEVTRGARPTWQDFHLPNTTQQTQNIAARDLFNTKSALGPKTQAPKQRGPCLASSTASNAGVTLVNTIVLQNQRKSVAALKARGKKGILSLWPGDTIPAVGKIGKIEHLKIIFRNDKTGQCEFAAIKQRSPPSPSKFRVLPPEQGQKLLDRLEQGKSVTHQGNHFTIKRSYLNQGMENISDLLGEVNAVQIKNPDGTLSFKITGVNPGGIFSKLGIENEDRITSIDGKPIRNQTEIFGLFQNLKTAENISITVLRNGTQQKLQYTFAD